MHCRRCHHADVAHAPDKPGASLVGRGPCQIPGCACGQYLDMISTIDEDLL